MFESKNQPLLPRSKFFLRMARSVGLGLFCIAVVLYVGMLGYHFFEQMGWLDAFANASMILSGMGPFGPLHTSAGKLFAGFYALFSGLAFIFFMSVVFAPIIHRFLHNFHVEEEQMKISKPKK